MVRGYSAEPDRPGHTPWNVFAACYHLYHTLQTDAGRLAGHQQKPIIFHREMCPNQTARSNDNAMDHTLHDELHFSQNGQASQTHDKHDNRWYKM